MTVKMNLGFLLCLAGLSLTMGRILHVTCPKHAYTMLAAQFSIQEICGPDFGLKDFDPTSLMGLTNIMVSANMKCQGDITMLTTPSASVSSSGDLVQTMGSLMFEPLDIGNKQQYCLMKFEVTANEGINAVTHESKPIQLMLLPDFGGASIAVVKIGTSTEPIQVENGDLKTAMALTNINVEFSNLPDTGAPFFAVAFLRPLGHDLVPNAECTEIGVGEDKFPYIEMSDIPVAQKSFYFDETTPIELVSLLPTDLTNICGKFELVFMADPMATLHSETRCDNYQHVRVYFQCASGEMSTPPMCHMTTNIFDPKSMAFMIKGVKADTTDMQEAWRLLYEPEQELYGVSWKKSMPEMDSSHMIKMRGYPLLDILWREIQTQYSGQCETGTDVGAALKELDGMETTTEYPEVTDQTFMAAFTQYKDQTDVNTLMGMLSEISPSENKMVKAVKEAVLKYLKNKADPSMPEHQAPHMEGKLEDLIKRISYGDSELYYEQYRAYVVGNLTSMLVKLKMASTTNTCFNEVYDILVSHLKLDPYPTIYETPLEEKYLKLFDTEKVMEYKKLTGLSDISWSNASRLVVSSCIKRMDGYVRSMCDTQMDITDPRLTKKICLLNHFRKFIKENVAGLGITYIKKELLKDRMKMAMNEYGGVEDIFDPLMVRNGGLQLWLNEEGDFNQYTISPSYDKVCKRKMATCVCPVCDNGMNGGTTMPGYPPYETTTTRTQPPPQPLKK